jgi:uncharacterized protein (TIGR03086 family)
MSETSERFRKVAADFTARVEAVPDGAWDNPSPCEGWVARDIVRHMVDTSAMFLGRAGAGVGDAPSPDDDPAATWRHVRDAMQQALDDPEVAGVEYDTPMGRSTLEQTVAMFGIGDVVIHTWDLARATGLDERLDPDEVHRLYEAMEPNDEMMRQSGVFGPKVEAPPDADEQTRLIAFSGRRP